jgi:pyruvate/2-oxoacid:ferredoxin oxidoreductase beta subunit/Pyruvate/2-oxoacid:ferredoxin oxidoreductase gamma subunit
MNLAQNGRPPILTAQRGDMCYCPGCSHGAVLEHLGAAVDRIGLRPEEVCVVSDIGCIGTADQYFACHTFHGLHGRSITYAEGIKRARPEMTVIVLIGDGGCGIGTAHLVHTARRGVGIKIIVCNNFNFGMTGGQHSPTTPPCMLTATTPAGAVEHPFDICQTVIANGATHVGRYSALDPDCSRYIETALRSPGFALIDLWELCTAYFVPSNRMKPQMLVELANKYKLPFGLLHDGDVIAHPLARLGKVAHLTRPTSSDVPRLRWRTRTEICIAGSAGQRIRSAAGAIGEIVVAAGLFASQLDDFPITVRKGHSISYLVLDGHPIRYAGVDRPDLVILLSAEGAARAVGLIAAAGRGLIIADDNVLCEPVAANVVRIDFNLFEKEVGKASAALAALTFGLVKGGWVEGAAILASARSSLIGKYREEQLRSIEFAVSLRTAGDHEAGFTGCTPQEISP